MTWKLTLYITVLLMPFTVTAQNGYWDWAVSIPDGGATIGNKVATDENGNVYVTGSFEGSVLYDVTMIYSKGASDVFIAKYDAAGNLIWGRTMGSAGSDVGTSVAVDKQGNAFVTGTYTGVFTASGSKLDSIGSTDIFIAKYNSSGSLVWLKSGGSMYYDDAADIGVDNNGDIYFAGRFGGNNIYPYLGSTIAFFDNDTLVGSRQGEICMVKYSSHGDVVWAKTMRSWGNGLLSGIFIDNHNNVFAGGTFSGSIDFDTVSLVSRSMGFIGSDMFLVKYDSAGNALWARGVSGKNSGGYSSGSVMGNKVTGDASGNVYMTGYRLGCDLMFKGTTVTPMYGNTFLAQYSSDGDFQWAQSVYYGEVNMKDITVDEQEELLLLGEYSKPVIVGNDHLEPTMGKIVVAKYDKYGNALAAVTGGTGGYNTPICIVMGSGGEIYITGAIYSSPVGFGDYKLYAVTGQNMFLAKFHSFPTNITNMASPGAGINIWPNPASNIIHIQGADPGTELQMLDIAGRVVYSHMLSGNATQDVNIAQLSYGAYIIQLTDSSGEKNSYKFIKQ